MNWSKFYREMIDRNIGVISIKEQEKLRKSCIAIAGCGGMGGLAAEQCVRLGVGRLKIADFDSFEIHNLSRQVGSTSLNIGQPKAEILGRYFREINPELDIEIFSEGVQADNVSDFVAGAGAVIDGIDYAKLYNSVILHRAARAEGLCIVNPQAIAFGVSVLIFGPKTQTIEEYIGLEDGADETAIKTHLIPIEKFMPYFPSYVDSVVAQKAASGEINIPNIIMPQHLGTAIAVSEVVMMLLGRIQEPPGPNPRIIVLDLQDRHFRITE